MVVGDSPVVPDNTRPSQPASTRWCARRAAAGSIQGAVRGERRHHGGQQRAQARVNVESAGAHGPQVTWRRQHHLVSAARVAQASVASGLVATSVPSASAAISKSPNTAGATSTSCRRHAMASRRISTSACSLARIAMKCRQAR